MPAQHGWQLTKPGNWEWCKVKPKSRVELWGVGEDRVRTSVESCSYHAEPALETGHMGYIIADPQDLGFPNPSELLPCTMPLDTGHGATGFGVFLAGFESCFNPISLWSVSSCFPLENGNVYSILLYIWLIFLLDLYLARLSVCLKFLQGSLNGNKT